MKQQFLVFVIAMFLAIGGFSLFFFYMGMQYGESNAKINCIKLGGTLWLDSQRVEPGQAFQYTVLDSDHVIMSNGDTVKYQWNKPKMRK